MDKSYKRKNYRPGGYNYSSNYNNKKKFATYLKPGMIGFLCTCNFREQDCVKECFNILNEYADKLLESAKPENETKLEGPDDAEQCDIEDELKKEISDLKSRQDHCRFSVADTGIPNNIFIKTTLENPVQLAYSIMCDIAETKKQKARFLLRIVPAEVTCKANLEEIKTAADVLFDKHFRCEPTTFAVIVNKRYNNNLLREDVITALALLVTDKNRDHKANLKEAKQTIVVEIMKGICCISVLEDYKRLRHYNIAELAKVDEPVGDGQDVKTKDVAELDKPEGNDQEVKEADEAEAKQENAEIDENEVIKGNYNDPMSDNRKTMEQD